ncbi:coiled-coil-helix-coiled-coil-helix domain-containing protein 1-like [Sinocyclocheilus rhinocerous]|uniref:Coiled-coil-helix-coiled-coil-helix domain-containing protein 1-like n=1 Tax=Sinocyclocheilus rhinocerous TaxID=307959 RepID=A0A673JP64_9TELE|nr:PREDICTED: coiled-coil-helix-coiled-coil-helix domain-containing protein 1-like [Sinocyclocheilus rhinocerous]
MSGSVIQEKVAKLLSRQNGKPVLRPIKPLALKNEVASRRLKKGEATCVTEMSLLLACWKQNDFNNSVCSKEVSVFYTCVEKAQNKAKGKQGTQGRLLPKEANTLLKRFPNLSSEILDQ